MQRVKIIFNSRSEHYLKKIVITGADTGYADLYLIAAITIHPSYTTNQDLNDIAILRTTTTMAFNEGVGSVCLPFKFVM